MARRFFLGIFFAVQIFLIFFYISIHNKAIKLSYQKQKLEKTLDVMNQEKQNLEHELSVITNEKNIQEYACKELDFQKIDYEKVKFINNGY